MKFLIDLLAGLVAMLAAAALSQLGIDLNQPTTPVEVKRVADQQPVDAPVSQPDENKTL